MIPELRGLTLWRPWDIAMCRLGKDIENRPKPPPKALVGALIALYTGQHFDKAGSEKIQRLTGKPLTHWDSLPGYIVGVMRLTGFVTSSDSKWFTGPFGITFTDLRSIEPVACKPKIAMGWWRMPSADIDALVRSRYTAALAVRS